MGQNCKVVAAGKFRCVCLDLGVLLLDGNPYIALNLEAKPEIQHGVGLERRYACGRILSLFGSHPEAAERHWRR